MELRGEVGGGGDAGGTIREELRQRGVRCCVSDEVQMYNRLLSKEGGPGISTLEGIEYAHPTPLFHTLMSLRVRSAL